MEKKINSFRCNHGVTLLVQISPSLWPGEIGVGARAKENSTMRRIKAWTQLIGGALCVILGIISVANFSFDWEFIMPSSLILGGFLILLGGTVFGHGLMALDSPPKPAASERAKQDVGVREP